jgi:hypothetical protein
MVCERFTARNPSQWAAGQTARDDADDEKLSGTVFLRSQRPQRPPRWLRNQLWRGAASGAAFGAEPDTTEPPAGVDALPPAAGATADIAVLNALTTEPRVTRKGGSEPRPARGAGLPYPALPAKYPCARRYSRIVFASCSGDVRIVSITTSASDGGSYGSETPVKC